jgi:hypothetical protein
MMFAGCVCAMYRQAEIESIEASLWKTIAFAARYGHQQVPNILSMTKRELDQFVEKLAEIMREEKDAMASAFEGG